MNYQIILEPQTLKEFVDWLPELEEGEAFYVSLFARKKYAPNIGLVSDKSQLKRFTAVKQNLIDKIKQLECPVGAYKQRDIEIPQESLALYITPNPRSLIKAAKNSAIQLVKLITQDYNGYNPHAAVMDEIQKACSRKIYVDFDFDGVSPAETLLKLQDKINIDCITTLQTKNGFHLLIEAKKIAKQFSSTWYKTITSLEGCDVRGDNLLPVPGCVQGNFCPRFV